MQERITQRLTELKALQASVEQEMAQIEQRRQYILQELLKLQGAVQALEGLAQDPVDTVETGLCTGVSGEHIVEKLP